MQECFTPKSFSASSLDIISKAVAICQLYAAQGYDLSLRQLYYQFVTRNWLVNREQSYNRLGAIISDARNAGLLDWDWIKDRGREKRQNGHWQNPGAILRACAQGYAIDTWQNQPNYVMCVVEKQALEGVLQPVCAELDIPFVANKGYSSDSLMYELGKEIEQIRDDGREVHVIYLGDHDPSGIDMTRDVGVRLERYSWGPVEVHRIALNMDQVRRYRPPENPAKLTDSRANSYIEEFGYSSWELDALEPTVLADLVRDQVRELRDETLHAEIVERQERERQVLAAYADMEAS